MNYVAFEGVSQLDNLYVAATGKMKAARILLDPSDKDKREIEEAIKFKKRTELEKEELLHTLCAIKEGTHENKCAMRFVIVWYNVTRVIYKTLYFYLFPYLIVPLSYSLWLNRDIPRDD